MDTELPPFPSEADSMALARAYAARPEARFASELAHQISVQTSSVPWAAPRARHPAFDVPLVQALKGTDFLRPDQCGFELVARELAQVTRGVLDNLGIRDIPCLREAVRTALFSLYIEV